MAKQKEPSELLDAMLDLFERTSRRRVERREREVERATEEVEVTLNDQRTVRCGRSV